MKGVGVIPVALAVAGVLLILFGLGLWLNVRPEKVKNEIDPVAVTQVGVTLLVGFFLTQYMTQKTGERKAEKEILIENVRDVLDGLREAFDSFETCCDAPDDKEEWQSLIRCFKRLSAQMSSLEDLLKECSVAQEQSRFKEAKTTLLRFKGRSTSRFPSPPSSAERVDAEAAYRDLHYELSRLVVTINRL